MLNSRQLNNYFLIPVVTLLMTGLFGCGSNKTVTKNQGTRQPTTIISPPSSGNTTERPTTHGNLRHDQSLLINEALTWLGVPYRYGGESHDGADCSGLSMMVYKTALGIKIPRNSAEQQKFCRVINQNDLEPGDLVFFSTGSDKSHVSHVGIFMGNDKFIHSSSTKGVIISRMSDRYFTSHYHSSGHVARDYDNSPQPTETNPLQLEIDATELDRAIEARIDSINHF